MAVDSMQTLLEQFEAAFTANDAARVLRGYVETGGYSPPDKTSSRAERRSRRSSQASTTWDFTLCTSTC